MKAVLSKITKNPHLNKLCQPMGLKNLTTMPLCNVLSALQLPSRLSFNGSWGDMGAIRIY